ncbi:carboxypeptidase M32, partial [Leptospira santarosai]
KNVHWKGKFYSAKDLIRSATGSDPDSSHLIRYLEKKLTELESIHHG